MNIIIKIKLLFLDSKIRRNPLASVAIMALASLLILLPAIAIAGTNNVAIRASVDKKSILVGDRLKYVIELTSREDIKVGFPKFPEYKIGGFEIKDSGSYVKKHFFGSRGYFSWYYITSYTVGKQSIPPVEVKYKLQNSNWEMTKTEDIPITVESVLPRKGMAGDIKDIKGPIYLYRINWPLVTGVVLLLCILFFIYRKMRKKVPVRLPHETALEELEAIKSFLARGGDVKEYYVRVSDCVRHYIERAFKLKAPEMTTEEFLNSLRDSVSLSPEQKELLKGFLRACDMVKFAKYTPSSSETEAVFTTAKQFVEETKDVRV